MDTTQILKFLAEVTNVAATHFGTKTTPPPSSPPGSAFAGESSPGANAAGDEQAPSPRRDGPADATAEATNAEACAICGKHGRMVILRMCELCMLRGVGPLLDRCLASWRTDLEALGQEREALAAERAECERLRIELAEVKDALARLKQPQVGSSGTTAIDEQADATKRAIVNLRGELSLMKRSLKIAHNELVEERAVSERLRTELEEMRRVFDGTLAGVAPAPVRGSEPPSEHPASTRGEDIEAELTIAFVQMLDGAVVPLRFDQANGGCRIFDVKVPPGINSGDRLRLRGQGGAGDPPGDIIVTVTIPPHPRYQRQGNDILMRVAVTPEAIRAGVVDVITPWGPLTVQLPGRLGQTLRFKGKGIAAPRCPTGDLLLTLDETPASVAPVDVPVVPHRSLPEFPITVEEFSTMHSLSPEVRAHFTTLAKEASSSFMRTAIFDVLWALAVAHEQGLREPLDGSASDILDNLLVRQVLRPAPPSSNRGRVFSWLAGRSRLVTKEGRPPGTARIWWTVHFESMSEPQAWDRSQPPTLAH